MKTYKEFITEAKTRSKTRLKMVNFSRGTTQSRADHAQKTGQMSKTSFGTLGPGHYVTHDQKKARKYAEINSKQRKDKPAVVHYKVGKKSVHDVDGIPKGTTTSNPDAPKGTKVIRNKRSGHSVFLDPEHAKRAQYTPKPTIRKRK